MGVKNRGESEGCYAGVMPLKKNGVNFGMKGVG